MECVGPGNFYPIRWKHLSKGLASDKLWHSLNGSINSLNRLAPLVTGHPNTNFRHTLSSELG